MLINKILMKGFKMKYLYNNYFLTFIISITFTLGVMAEDKKLKFNKDLKKNKNGQKKEAKFNDHFEKISEERKDYILSEFDSDGDGKLNEDERIVFREQVMKYKKNK